MPKSNVDMENWHKHRGRGLVFFGILILFVGLMAYYKFSAPVILIIAGILIILFGASRMMQ